MGVAGSAPSWCSASHCPSPSYAASLGQPGIPAQRHWGCRTGPDLPSRHNGKSDSQIPGQAQASIFPALVLGREVTQSPGSCHSQAPWICHPHLLQACFCPCKQLLCPFSGSHPFTRNIAKPRGRWTFQVVMSGAALCPYLGRRRGKELCSLVGRQALCLSPSLLSISLL